MYKLLMSNFLRNSHTKKHRNRLIFDRVIGKIKRGPFFCGHSVFVCVKRLGATVFCEFYVGGVSISLYTAAHHGK